MKLLKKEKEEEKEKKKIKKIDFSLFRDISITVYMCSSFELQKIFCMLRVQAQKS